MALKLNWTNQLLAYAYDVILRGYNIDKIKKDKKMCMQSGNNGKM
jgi:hypothetical protein